jgi:SagB-type dehydrogenase family enzyme
MKMIKTALQYHEYSSYERGRIGGHYLDWRNQPTVYKDYPGIDPVQLPASTPQVKGNLSAIFRGSNMDEVAHSLSIEDISLILSLTNTPTAKATYSGEDFYYRSAASAGALYPTEIYMAVRGIKGLDDGLYYFSIHRNALFPLRIDDLSEYIAGLTIPLPKKLPIITFFFTAIFFRSAWKYRDRSYRYHLLDTGHVIENLTLAMKALRIPFYLSYDFDDRQLNRLLGLDHKKEVSLALAHVPGIDSVSGFRGKEIHALTASYKNASIVSKKELDYPAVGEIHGESGSVISRQGNHENEMMDKLGVTLITREGWPVGYDTTDKMDYPECLFKRRSSRNFVQGVLDKEDLFPFMDIFSSESNHESDREPIYNQSLCVGFLTNTINGMTPGLYMLDIRNKNFGLVHEGPFTDIMAHTCLDQEWLKNASTHFVFLSNIDLLDRIWGARGYRYAMLTAGRLGERIYVTATSMGLGCCGIGAFYDGEAAGLMGLNKESHLLYLVAVGKVKTLFKSE